MHTSELHFIEVVLTHCIDNLKKLDEGQTRFIKRFSPSKIEQVLNELSEHAKIVSVKTAHFLAAKGAQRNAAKLIALREIRILIELLKTVINSNFYKRLCSNLKERVMLEKLDKTINEFVMLVIEVISSVELKLQSANPAGFRLSQHKDTWNKKISTYISLTDNFIAACADKPKPRAQEAAHYSLEQFDTFVAHTTEQATDKTAEIKEEYTKNWLQKVKSAMLASQRARKNKRHINLYDFYNPEKSKRENLVELLRASDERLKQESCDKLSKKLFLVEKEKQSKWRAFLSVFGVKKELPSQ